MQNKIIEILINKGNNLLKQPYEKNSYTGNPEADNLLNDLISYPHTFVLACIMDRQQGAGRSWHIPHKISTEIGGFEFSRLLQITSSKYNAIFQKYKFHRFYNIMAKNFYLAIQRIHKQYDDNASNIWKDKPTSATIVRRFLEFDGVGTKIATMATNILAREFKIPMRDYCNIDISPDRHIMLVFSRIGLLSKNAKKEELFYLGRELNPEYPGVFDYHCWEIGKKWCKPQKPLCNECCLSKYCPKII
jgi:endonuclease III